MEVKKITAGLLTSFITMFGPVQTAKAQENTSSDNIFDNQIELLEKQRALYNEIEKRFFEGNAKTATNEASKTMQDAMSMLAVNDSSFNAYMKNVHNMFEDKEVHAERLKAYTVQKNDNEKLATMKKTAKKTYDECLRRADLLIKADKELKAYLQKHPEVTPEEQDSLANKGDFDEFLNSSENPLNVDEKKLKLQLNYANAMKDLVEKQGELAELDAPLRIAQLNQNIFMGNLKLRQLKKNIKEWDKLQKEVEKVQGELTALKLEQFDNNGKSKLGDNQDENNKLSDESVITASKNLEKARQAKELDTEIKGLQTKQAKLGARKALVYQEDSINGDITNDKNELKSLRKKRGDYTIKEFTKDPYEDSELRVAANALAVVSKRNKDLENLDADEIYQNKIFEYYGEAEKVESKILPNGSTQNDFTIKGKDGEYVVTTIEYPDGRSTIFDKDNIYVYDKSGKLHQTYKQEKSTNGKKSNTNSMVVSGAINNGNYR